MEIKKISAIFDEFRLKDVEQSLIDHGIKGFTLQTVRGRGRYYDSFNETHLIKHIQMDVYVKAEQAKAIVDMIIDVANVNADSEGFVCILPVNEFYWIHDKRSATDSDFQFHDESDE